MQVIKLPAADVQASLIIKNIEAKLGHFALMAQKKEMALIEYMVDKFNEKAHQEGFDDFVVYKKDVTIAVPDNAINRKGFYLYGKLIGEIRVKIDERLLMKRDDSGYNVGFVPIQKIENCPFPTEL